MLGEVSPAELLPIGPGFVGSPKVKSAFATSAAGPNVKTNTIEISFIILVFIEIFSYLIRIFQKLPLKNTYTPITQLPDISLTSPGKPCHLPHMHNLLTDI
jgi:hypothetical protein